MGDRTGLEMIRTLQQKVVALPASQEGARAELGDPEAMIKIFAEPTITRLITEGGRIAEAWAGSILLFLMTAEDAAREKLENDNPTIDPSFLEPYDTITYHPDQSPVFFYPFKAHFCSITKSVIFLLQCCRKEHCPKLVKLLKQSYINHHSNHHSHSNSSTSAPLP